MAFVPKFDGWQMHMIQLTAPSTVTESLDKSMTGLVAQVLRCTFVAIIHHR